MSRPTLLDLFCGAGGSAAGYAAAGFAVVGVDHVPQPRYPFRLVVADGLEYVAAHGRDFDAIHASPPCQAYSVMRNLPWLRDRAYPALIEPTREALDATGRPWVLENVMGAKLPAGFLCGTMFGRRFYRHRAFESGGGFFWLAPLHPRHRVTIRPGRHLGGRARRIVFANGDDDASGAGRRWQSAALDRTGAGVGVGHAAGFREAAREMGCAWMRRDELSQAIPPCYTEFVGTALRRWLEGGT